MKSITSKIVLVFVLLFLRVVLFSQSDSTYFQLPDKQQSRHKKLRNYDWLEKISVGGNFAFFTSTRASFIDISPLVAYRLSKSVMVGAGPVYNYYSDNTWKPRITFSIYGLRTMARVYFLESLFFQIGWDLLNRNVYFVQYNTLQKKRVWVQNIWIGGGVRYAVGANAYMFTSVLYNLNENEYSPYPNPYVQVGFITGF